MCADSLLTPSHDIWKKGIPFGDAPYHFAPPNLRARYNEPQKLPRKSISAIELLAKKFIDENKRQDFIKSAQPVQDFFDISQARAAVERTMRDRLLAQLSDNTLVAYGFVTPRKPANTPEKIPPDLFKYEFVNWEESSIKGEGLEFKSVIVFRPKWVREIEALLPKDTHRAIGRPSSKHAITAAIQSLIDEQAIPIQSRKRDYELIRARVNSLFPGQFPENKNLSDKVIAKYLGPELARLKSAKNPPHKL